MLNVKLAGLGSYLPERIVTSAELEHAYDLAPGWVVSAVGPPMRRQ
jgi:3-oxoacyl-[acyl-carrier-protein] synthase III